MSEPNTNTLTRRYLESIIRKAWSGCLEIPIEWLGRSDDELLSKSHVAHPVLGLLQSLGEEQIKSIHVKEQTLRMLDVYDPLPEFLEPITMLVDVEEQMVIDAFFTNFAGVMNRESIVNGPFRDDISKNTSEMEFAVLINRYGSRPCSEAWGFAHEHSLPSLANQSLYRAFFMRITQTHPALTVGKVEENKMFTPTNSQQILKSLVPLTEPSFLVVDPKQVTIIAHYPASPNLRSFYTSPRFSSLVLDSIESHMSVEMSLEFENIWENPPSDTTWIYDRLRLGMALLRILKNSRHILLMWDELWWSSDILLWEEEHDKKVANIKWRTPNPSENSDDLWVEALSEEKRRAFEEEKEDIRLRYEVYCEDEMDMDMLTTNGSDDANSEVLENLVRESIERVSLWLNGLSKDTQQFNPFSKD
ncbi:hypothetical protein Clacol_004844 [Clathrus columnatus]|uniref:Uncharacterized protein n=1 Tax=Clathrus columnatus TaxID=1419009 RepID=A0AAV5AAK5_9AGAM|nr:hypothetical protein Clacol_004844 [Clathrus columnatus]